MPSTRDRRILRHPGLQPLWDSLERERVQQQIAAVALIIVGLLAAVCTLIYRRPAYTLLASVVATAALWWLYRIVSDQPLAALRRQLHEEPESIRWVYSTVTERMPFGFKTGAMGTLYLVEANGVSQSYDLKPKSLKLVTKTLTRVLPHAKFGYTEERDLEYRGEITRVGGQRPNNENFPD